MTRLIRALPLSLPLSLAAFVALASLTTPAPAHAGDCRIAQVVIATPTYVNDPTYGPLMRLVVWYRGFDGTRLQPRLCPDQAGPTWGLPTDPVSPLDPPARDLLLDPFQQGFIMYVHRPLPGRYTVYAATSQHPFDRELSTARSILVP